MECTPGLHHGVSAGHRQADRLTPDRKIVVALIPSVPYVWRIVRYACAGMGMFGLLAGHSGFATSCIYSVVIRGVRAQIAEPAKFEVK
jgi:hypothetical protein